MIKDYHTRYSRIIRKNNSDQLKEVQEIRPYIVMNMYNIPPRRKSVRILLKKKQTKIST